MTNHTTIFEDYYAQQFWGNRDGSSGPNSAFSETPLLRANLASLFQDYSIKSICDAGCGDSNLFKFIPLGEISYTGIECVPALTALNQKTFAQQNNFQFVTQDVVNDALPKADLIICRDVLHYLPNALIQAFLENCQASGSRYLLTTHNTHSPESANTETRPGIFRPVNLTQKPFNWPTPVTTIKEDVFAKEMALYSLSLKDNKTNI